jgi:uncharacterized protein (DUF58 family)
VTENARKYLQPELLARIGELDLRARYVVEGFVSGMHRSPYHGFSVEFAQHREYVPGDDLRHLDWRVYGKSDRYYIKQFEEETNLCCYLALDCSQSMRYPEQDAAEGRMTKFEYGATLAASLAYLLVHQQDAVGLMLFDSRVRSELPPLSNHAHVRSLVHRLEQARLDHPTETSTLFTRLGARMRRRSMVILISDLLADPQEIILGLERLRHGNHEVIVMHLLDHDERTFPFMDNTRFEGLETPDVQVFADPQSLRSAYLEAMDQHTRAIRTACINRRIDFVELSTTDAMDVALRRYLAARAHMMQARA